MGRFETTAQTYAARREPYPQAFFAAVAEALKLQDRETLIDLGTGPGLIALGFAPYVARVYGVDPEPAMAAEARRAAAKAEVDLQIIEGRAEDLAVEIGRFDIVTIGRALHWMEREATLKVLDRILAPGGRIVICGASARAGEANPWRAAYETTLSSWGESRLERHRQIYEHWFDGSPFAEIAEVKVSHRQDVTPEALVERALTRSTTSPAVLGPRLGAFRAALLEALAPFFADGIGIEAIEAKAAIFSAR
jgi:ubiquinone/menaquinone biosynthesis C-methylase UbiE